MHAQIQQLLFRFYFTLFRHIRDIPQAFQAPPSLFAIHRNALIVKIQKGDFAAFLIQIRQKAQQKKFAD